MARILHLARSRAAAARGGIAPWRPAGSGASAAQGARTRRPDQPCRTARRPPPRALRHVRRLRAAARVDALGGERLPEPLQRDAVERGDPAAVPPVRFARAGGAAGPGACEAASASRRRARQGRRSGDSSRSPGRAGCRQRPRSRVGLEARPPGCQAASLPACPAQKSGGPSLSWTSGALRIEAGELGQPGRSRWATG